MNENIKRMFFVLTLVTLLATVGAVCAADDANTTAAVDSGVSDVATVSETASDTLAAEQVTTTSDDNKVDTKTIEKEEKNLKKEPKTHIVNNDTITEIFSNNGTSPYANFGFNSSLLGDDINDGDTIDIQGSITGNYNLTINKAVNIISSTHDALIDLNTTNPDLTGGSPGNHFIIDHEGAYTNVTGINFHNTQLFVRNTTHVTLDNISVINERQIGGGIGGTAIRANATYITVKNSYFYTKGSSSTMIALTWADYCTIDNCTIISEGSGNLFYLNHYNLIADVPEDIETNIYNNVTNCVISGGPGGISMGMVLHGKYTNVINNTLYVGGIGGDANATIINNTLHGGYIDGGKYILNNTVYRNSITCAADTFVVNNTAESFNVGENSTVENNTGNFVLHGNCYLHDNNIQDLTINTNNNTVSHNFISGIITIKGRDNYLNDNNITGYDFNSISITGRNNTITDNYITSYNASGNDCVWARRPEQNIVANNTPESNVTYVIITEESYSQYFDNNGLFNSEIINNNTNIILKDSFTNKNFTFKNVYAGLIGQNAILYNSTITLDENTHMGLNNITLNNSLYNSKNSIIVNSEYNRIDNTTIYHGGNTDIESITINAKNNRLFNNTIRITPDTTNIRITAIKTTKEKTNISDNNIFIIKDSLNNAKAIDLGANNNTVYKNIITINSENIEAITLNNSGGNIIQSNNINLTGTSINAIKATTGNSSNNNISRNTIDLKSSNNAIGILIDSQEQIDSNNIEQNTIYANVTNNLTMIRVTQKPTTKYSTVYLTRIVRNSLYANASNVMGIVLTAVEPYLQQNNIYLNATNNTIENSDDYIQHSNSAVIIQNSSYIELSLEKYYLHNVESLRLNSVYNGSISISANTTNTIPVYIDNSYNILAHWSLNINTTELNTINVANCDNITITNNQLNANDTYGGDASIKIINTTNSTIENNIPILLYITNDNFYEFFDENNTLNTEGTIILGSDLYNKDMIILSNTTIDNRKNYTIYNGSIIFNSKNNNYNGLSINNLKFNNSINKTIITANETNINIQKLTVNAQNNTLPIIINYNSPKFTLNNSQIISNQTYAKLIQLINSTNQNTITNNYLLTNTSMGDGTIESINSQFVTIKNNTPIETTFLTNDNYNNYFDEGIYKGADYIEIASDIYNKTMTFNKAVIINGCNYTLYNSTITSTQPNTEIRNINLYYENNQTPSQIITINSGIIENCNITTKADTVDVITATGETRIIGITINGEANQIRAIVSMCDFLILEKYYIYLTSPNPTKAIDIEVGGIGSAILYEYDENNPNTIIVNATNNGIPLVYTSEEAGGELYYLYIESKDDYGMNSISPNIYAENIYPYIYSVGFKTMIKIQIPEQILINKENIIQINPTDIFGQEINGTTTLNDGEQSIKTTNRTIKYTPLSTGEKTLTITYNDPTGKYDSTTITTTITVKQLSLTVNTINATAGQTINITARITADDETITDINKGKITFKVNGKTLKDPNGKVIYAKVVNGTATIENYIVPSDWAKEGTTIQAVYSGSTQCEKLTSEKTNITVEKAAPTFTTESVTGSAGSTVQLKATITDGDKVINSGKVVFKINGKTVKDENGKVIYAKVDANGEVSVDYNLGNLKAGSYTIEATFISPNYDKITSNTTMTVVKA